VIVRPSTYKLSLALACASFLSAAPSFAQPGAGAVNLDAPLNAGPSRSASASSPSPALAQPRQGAALSPAIRSADSVPQRASLEITGAAAEPATGKKHRGARAQDKAAKRDPLDPTLSTFVKDEPPTEVNLPGVIKLDGAKLGLLDPARAHRISCTNEGSVTVYLSATEPNRMQLPFPNPRVVGTSDYDIDKRPHSNNIYVTFKGGSTNPTTLWLEPQEGGSVSCGFQLIPKRIPAQSVHVVDDSGALTPKAGRPEEPNDFLSRVQGDLEDALEGRAPSGWSTVNIPVPPIAVDGVMVEGVRRLSSLREDIYVYTVLNPGAGDIVLDETQFDGPTVEAVSILPTPLLHARGTTRVAVLVRKSALLVDESAVQPPTGER
jgi:conjugal transfer pilus assembly protein TraK